MNKLNELIAKRRSTINFSSKSIEEEKVQLLFEAARWASSSYNEQPWRFIYATSDSEEHDEFSKMLMPGNLQWASKAPLLIVSVAKRNLDLNDMENKYAWHDVGLAVSNLIIEATELGLSAHQMGGFDKGLAIKKLNIPEGYEPVTMIAVGYNGNIDELPENLKNRESKQRTRLPLEMITHKGKWTNN